MPPANFTDLPLEIRVMIYELILPSSGKPPSSIIVGPAKHAGVPLRTTGQHALLAKKASTADIAFEFRSIFFKRFSFKVQAGELGDFLRGRCAIDGFYGAFPVKTVVEHLVVILNSSSRGEHHLMMSFLPDFKFSVKVLDERLRRLCRFSENLIIRSGELCHGVAFKGTRVQDLAATLSKAAHIDPIVMIDLTDEPEDS
ncbi:uncharacterized protein KY384_002776 [Bacidia gigantensis]|uniref:uncharacterized protein n=1 Tax=Bacidia gigantensis TaxID=2732470 RepID=UPI001D047A70|nr:uncharacterized protein KY384_002776 [Bacidia gigantensis]KAG8532898.1 hypothetical protein KY384_002776 [Bacidia gigantensis]